MDMEDTLIKGPPGVGLGLRIRHDGKQIVVEVIFSISKRLKNMM
jgi:hypothetical protein